MRVQTDKPIKDGYYWFKFEQSDVTSLMRVNGNGVWELMQEERGENLYAEYYSLEMLHGEWWGPLVSPWEREEEDKCGNCPYKESPW